MFTGIVQGVATITGCEKEPGLTRFEVDLGEPLSRDLAIGASVALDGVCMTVTAIRGAVAAFDAVAETLQRSTLGLRCTGDRINVERSFRHSEEVGGHILSGHIDTMARVTGIETSTNNRLVTYEVPAQWSKYIFPKGFIAVDGCSLTVVDVDRKQHRFSVSLIPETLRATLHGARGEGDQVNIEIDRQTQVIVDTVERVLAERDMV